MLSARGIENLLLFTPDGKHVKKYWASMGQPLWCEGSRIYLEFSSNMGGFRMDPIIAAAEPEDSMPTGDVLDFSDGIEDPLITSVERLAEVDSAVGSPTHR